jgi:hypothetical protein
MVEKWMDQNLEQNLAFLKFFHVMFLLSSVPNKEHKGASVIHENDFVEIQKKMLRKRKKFVRELLPSHVVLQIERLVSLDQSLHHNFPSDEKVE